MFVRKLKSIMVENNKSTALEFWNQFANKQSPEVIMNTARIAEWEMIRKIFNITPSSHPRIIELGVGTGHFAINFLKEGFYVTGVDISEESLKVCEKRAQNYGLEKKLNLVLSNFKKKEFNESFDAGYTISTFHCLSSNPKEQDIILKNFLDSIKKDGVVFIMEPNPFNVLYYFAYPFVYKNNWREGYNVIHSSAGRLRKLLQEYNVSDIKRYHYGFFPTSFMRKIRFIGKLNNFLCRTPLIKNFCLFNFFIGIKK